MVDTDSLFAPPKDRAAEVQPCWLCGIRLPVAQMMADGGSSCDDLRWYCRDVRGCTERWAFSRRRRGGALPASAQPAGQQSP